MAEPLAIWQPFGLHPFFACIFDFGGDPSSKGGAGRLRKSSDCVLEYFFEISLLMFFFIHQCEKGKPPTGVNYQFFLKNPAVAGSKEQDL